MGQNTQNLTKYKFNANFLNKGNILYVKNSNIVEKVSDKEFESIFSSLYYASNAREALALYEKYSTTLDVLIIDISIAKKENIAFIRKIRKENETIKIVPIVEKADSRELYDLLELRVDNFIVKPIQFGTMLNILSNMLSNILSVKLFEEHSIEVNLYRYIYNSNFLKETTSEGIITYVNDAYCSITGYDRDELIQKKNSKVVHNDMSERIFDDIKETLDQGNIWEGLIKKKKKNDEHLWFKTTIYPIHDKNNRVKKYMYIYHDMTEEIDNIHNLSNKKSTLLHHIKDMKLNFYSQKKEKIDTLNNEIKLLNNKIKTLEKENSDYIFKNRQLKKKNYLSKIKLEKIAISLRRYKRIDLIEKLNKKNNIIIID